MGDIEIMRLPSWNEFEETLSDFEKILDKKIKEFQEDHPQLDRAIRLSIKYLPAPFSEIANDVYTSFDGSEQEKSEAVLSYLNDLKGQGKVHYEKIAYKLDGVLSEVKDLKSLGENQTKVIIQIKNTLQSDIKNIDQKIDQLKNNIRTIEGTVQINNQLLQQLLGVAEENKKHSEMLTEYFEIHNEATVDEKDVKLFMEILSQTYDQTAKKFIVRKLADGYMKMGIKFEFLILRALDEAPSEQKDESEELKKASIFAILNILEGKYSDELSEDEKNSVAKFALQILEQKDNFYVFYFLNAAQRILDLPKTHDLRDVELSRRSIWKFYENAKNKKISDLQLLAITTILKEELEPMTSSLELIKEGTQIAEQISNDVVVENFFKVTRNYATK